nr:terminase gpA endonuclease subunit [Cedecea sp. FDAARGOS_727]
MASKRTTTFMSSGMTLVESSPGRDVRDTKWRRSSPHELLPPRGSFRYTTAVIAAGFTGLPHCGEYFQPEMDNMAGYREVADPVAASEAAVLQCPACKGKITPDMKRSLNMKCVWLRDGQRIDADGGISGEGRRSRIASFWMEGPAAAYQTWAQLIYKFLTAEQEYEATRSEETLKTVVNTDFGGHTSRDPAWSNGKANCWNSALKMS